MILTAGHCFKGKFRQAKNTHVVLNAYLMDPMPNINVIKYTIYIEIRVTFDLICWHFSSDCNLSTGHRSYIELMMKKRCRSWTLQMGRFATAWTESGFIRFMFQSEKPILADDVQVANIYLIEIYLFQHKWLWHCSDDTVQTHQYHSLQGVQPHLPSWPDVRRGRIFRMDSGNLRVHKYVFEISWYTQQESVDTRCVSRWGLPSLTALGTNTEMKQITVEVSKPAECKKVFGERLVSTKRQLCAAYFDASEDSCAVTKTFPP